MSGSEGRWYQSDQYSDHCYTDHKTNQAAFIIAKTDGFPTFVIQFCRTVGVGSFFDSKFSKVRDFETKP